MARVALAATSIPRCRSCSIAAAQHRIRKMPFGIGMKEAAESGTLDESKTCINPEAKKRQKMQKSQKKRDDPPKA
jgi:hypothetical protein